MTVGLDKGDVDFLTDTGVFDSKPMESDGASSLLESMAFLQSNR